MPQSASRRHREKINATLEELGGLLPLPEESRSKLDKLTVLKLSVSFFQTQNYLVICECSSRPLKIIVLFDTELKYPIQCTEAD